MSELVVFVLRILFLALLWLFILFIANIVRTDMWGKVVPVTEPKAKPKIRAAADPPAPAAPVAAPAPAPPVAQAVPFHVRMDTGPLTGRMFTLSNDLSLGRSMDNDLVLTDDFASGHHARISPTPTGAVLTDLGSTNGTFLNDERVYEPRQLQRGDQIRIGRTIMTLGR